MNRGWNSPGSSGHSDVPVVLAVGTAVVGSDGDPEANTSDRDRDRDRSVVLGNDEGGGESGGEEVRIDGSLEVEVDDKDGDDADRDCGRHPKSLGQEVLDIAKKMWVRDLRWKWRP